MKTNYIYNGIVLNINSLFMLNGAQVKLISFYDGEYVLVEDSACVRKWHACADAGITITVAPEFWYVSLYTGKPVALRETHESMTCAELNPLRFTHSVSGCNTSAGPHWVRKIPNPEFRTVCPTLTDWRMKDGVPQVRVGGRYHNVCNTALTTSGERYDTTTHAVYNGLVYHKNEMVVIDGQPHPKSLTVNAYKRDGSRKRILIRDAVEIDGKSRIKSECYALLDCCGCVGEYVFDEPEDRVFVPFRNGYAEEGDTCTCEATGERHMEGDGDWLDDQWYCDRWLSDNTFVCESCDLRHHNDNYGGNGYCESCYEDDDDRNSSDSNGVRSYSDKSADTMTPERDIPIKFGIELEVEAKSSVRESIKAFGFPARYCVQKDDGSLGSYGYEIVTRPDCPSVHKRIFGEMLAKEAVRNTTTSWTNGRCGIHIHVSRAPLSKLWIGRMLVLVNSDSMKPIVSKVAGRYNVTYSGIRLKKLTDGKRNGDSRYDALNTSASKTIEFRIFKGTLNREGFLKNIEFVEAVLAYCKPCTCSNRDVNNPDEFVSFLRKSRKSWPNLWKFLVDKGLAVK